MAAPMRVFSLRAAFGLQNARRSLERCCGGSQINLASCRTLFSDEILGIEGYKKHRSYTLERMGNMKDVFRSKMEQYLSQQGETTVFSDDLKTLLSIAETEEDVQLAVNMLKVYLGQETLRFNTFMFGPVAMRMLHMLRLPDVALDMYNDPALSSLFDQVSSCLNLMDNLFVCDRHDDVIAVFPSIIERYGGGERFPRDCLTLYVASCLHKSEPACYQEMLSVLSKFKELGPSPPDKAFAIAAYTALTQNDPKIAIELSSSGRATNSPGPLNVRAQALALLDRPDDALALVTTVLYRDTPHYAATRQDVFQETLDVIRACVGRLNKPELQNKFDIVNKDLTVTGQVNAQPLKHYLLQPVVRGRQMKAGFKSRQRSPAHDFQKSENQLRFRRGLHDE